MSNDAVGAVGHELVIRFDTQVEGEQTAESFVTRQADGSTE